MRVTQKKGRKSFSEALQEEFFENHVPELGHAFKVLIEALRKPKPKATDKNCALVRYLGVVLEITELDESNFCAWSGSNAWAYIFNQTGQALERSILDSERDILLKQCENFAKSSRSPPLFQEVFVLAGLIDYLKTHTIDPCNLFVSNFPADVMLKFQFIHPNKEKGIVEEEQEKENEEEKQQKKKEDKKKRRRRTREFFRLEKKKDQQQQQQDDIITTIFEKNFDEPFSPPLPTKAFERKQRILSNSFTPMTSSPPPTSPRKQRLLSSSFYNSTPPPTSLSPPNSPPPCPLLLSPQLISSFKGGNFDSLQTLVARWENVKNCPNFAEIEISILKKLLAVSLPHSPGELVAVEIDDIPESHRGLFTNDKWEQKSIWKSVYCRIKRCLPVSQQVEVWITPEEDTFVVIPESAVISFDWEKIYENEILPQRGNGTARTCVGNPLLFLENELHNLMEEQAKKLLKEHGVSYSDGKAGVTNYSTVWENHVKLQKFLARGDFSKQEGEGGITGTMKRLEEEVEGWLKNLPLFSYKHSYCKNSFLREVKQLTGGIQFNFQAIFQREYQHSSGILEALRTKLFAISGGKRKNAVCGWWLETIEKETRQFLLSQKGFAKDSLPPDYTDRPPNNLQAVASNLEIIQKLLMSKELKEFVNDLIRVVYTVLDIFLAELEFYLDPRTPYLEPFVGDEEIEAIFKPEVLEPVKKDYEYLKKMQEMDMEISLREEKDEGSEGKKGLEMTDVVPVGGLIMARFHMEEVEHSTAMDLWGGGEELEETRATTPLDLAQVNSIEVAKKIHLDRLSIRSSHMSSHPSLSPANLLLDDPLHDPFDPFSFPLPPSPPFPSPPRAPSLPPSPPSPSSILDDIYDGSPSKNIEAYKCVSPHLPHPSYSYSSLPLPSSSLPPSPPPSPPPSSKKEKLKKRRQIPSTFLEFLGFDTPPSPPSNLPLSYRYSIPPSPSSSPSSSSSSHSPLTFSPISPPPSSSSPSSVPPLSMQPLHRSSPNLFSSTRPRSVSPLYQSSRPRPTPPLLVGSPRSPRPMSPPSSSSITVSSLSSFSCSPPVSGSLPSSCSSPPPDSGSKRLWRAPQSFSSLTKYKEGNKKAVNH